MKILYVRDISSLYDTVTNAIKTMTTTLDNLE